MKEHIKEIAGIFGTIATVGALILGFSFLDNPEATTIKVKHFFNIASSPLNEQQSPALPRCPDGQKREMQKEGNDYQFICK